MREVTRKATPIVAPTLLDRAIGWLAPAAGLERVRARAELSAETAPGGYTGGRRDRRALRNWRPPAGSADADTLPDLPDLRARSRDLVRNTPIATGAVATVVTNVVGEGLQLEPVVDADMLGLDKEAATAWQQRAKREWWLFCMTADFSRVQTFDELQALVFRASLESGDCIVVRRYRKDAGDVYGTKLQVLEADRLSNPDRKPDSDVIAGGVEVDRDGVPVAYHISDRHPSETRHQPSKWTQIKARTEAGVPVVLHLFDRLRPELTRGIPYLAPVVEHVQQLGRYSNAEVTAAVIAAMYTVFVETDADEGEGPIAGEMDAALAANEVKLGNGAIVTLARGEKVNIANPGRPNANFDPFVQAFLRQVGVALELPFELLIKHFTASYSASRAALEMAWQFFRRRRAWLAQRLCQTVYEWMLEEAIATGRLAAPGFFDDPLIRQAYAGAEWHGPNRMSLDPLKEANADKTDIETGVKTRQQVCLERTGGQWEDKERQLAKEAAQRKTDGLSAPPPTAAESAPLDPSADPNADDEPQRQSA